MPRSTELESFLGFDPIDKEFKLLSIRFEENQILTLGTGKDSWRKIHCPLTHSPRFYGICINGVLYYIAEQTYGRPSMIVCFDVRSEKFKFIRKDFLCDCGATKLINYKGKLGVVTLEYTYSSTKLCLWIMKDVENPESEWSEYFCKEYHYFGGPFSIVGVTATGDIVLSTRRSVPFYVFYIDPKTNTLQIVEIQGLGRIRDYDSVEVFTDYVEDLKFINKMTRYAATTIRPSAPEQKPKPTTTSTLSKASF